VTPMYMPVIRVKEGERRALANLEPQTLRGLVPLFDVQRNDEKTSLHEHVRDSVDVIRQIWSANGEFLVDISQIPSDARCGDGTHPIAAIGRACREAGLRPTFAYAFDRSDSPYDEAIISSVLASPVPRRLAFRLQDQDVLFWQETVERMTGIVARGDVALADVTVIIDLQALSQASSVDTDMLGDRLQALDKAGFGRLVLLASSMPRSESLKADTTVTIRRLEVAVWESMLRFAPRLLFGDYGIVHPHFAHLKGSAAPIPAPKAKYATPSNWQVIKGHKPRKGEGSQYPAIARQIVQASWFRSNDFGWGAERIREVATKGSGKRGTPTCWVSFCTQIHLAITARQVEIAAARAASMASPVGDVF
jgi:hypothetical protein